MLTNVLIGADIECFLTDENKNVISAEGYVQGSKHEPYLVRPSLSEFFSTSLDNVLAEFTIPPAKSLDEFVEFINLSKMFLKETIPQELNLFFHPDNLMDEKFLKTENAQTFGCDVSYSAWTNKPISMNKKKFPNLRTAGFHVHIGYDERSMELNRFIIKTLDLFLGLPSILIEPDNMRRLLYGKPGEYRNKSYGCEYRTLSSYFASTNSLIEWVYKNTQSAIDFIKNGNNIEDSENDCNELVEAITNSNKELARKLVNKYNIQLP